LAPRLIAREDEDVSLAVADFLKEEGIDVRVDSKVVGIERQGNSIAVKIELAGKISQVAGTHVLVATGRRPNTDDLGLDNALIATDSHGYIRVDDQLRTNVPGIWAMGDCNGRGAFTHTSWNDFEIVAANILDKEQRRVSDRITAYALYTDPPLGRAGMTEAEVRKTGKPALISTIAMEDVSRAYEKSETKGFMKVLVDPDNKQILGASLLGLAGDEVIHCIIDLMYAKAPYTVMQHAMHIHPTVSEFLPTMMQDLRPLQ
jgi:pyruvate/2-oxoglutarate dehydrogenase complex dihydrolipoamide dehydrogenase (E3) component